MSFVRWAVAAPMAVLLLAFAGCGDDEEAAAPPPGRFCALLVQLDDIALATGASSTPGSYDGPAEAVGRLLDQMGPTLEELETAAPSQVRGDAGTLVNGLRQAREGGPEAVRSPTFVQANEGVRAFHQQSCPTGGGEGEL